MGCYFQYGKTFTHLAILILPLILISCGTITVGGNPGYGEGGNSGSPTQLPETAIRAERINFRRGSNSAVVQGSIRGRETVDYLLQVQTGMVLNIRMSTDNSSAFFNVLQPGEMFQSVFVGSRSGRILEGTASRSGDYRIRVYMMENAANRGERANFRLEVVRRQPPNSGPSWGSGGDNFQASGQIPCSMGTGAPTRECEFGVVRRGRGSAEITVFRPNGSRRIIFFQNGRATGYDQSQSGRETFRSFKEADLYVIFIGTERYEIPEALVFGG